MNKKRQELKLIKLTRVQVEILVTIILFVCGISVFTLTIKEKTSLTLNNGQVKYTGYVVNHRMNGQGKLTYANGDAYTGNFSNGVFNGQGQFVASNGWSYKGNFKNGQPDGQGKLKAKNGKVYKGTFKQGIYQK